MCENLGSNFEEAIFAECHSGGENLRIGVVYRSPSSDNENNDNLCHLINEAMSDNPDNLLILGDFNYKEIDWLSGSCNTLSTHPAHKFLSACKNAFLIQNQTEPTRLRDGQEPSLLDLVLTNRDDIVNEISTEAGLGKSDHVTLIINLNWTNNKQTSERPNYHKADYESIISFLMDIDWQEELRGMNTNEMWQKIKALINKAVDNFIPVTKHGNQKTKKWMDKKHLKL